MTMPPREDAGEPTDRPPEGDEFTPLPCEECGNRSVLLCSWNTWQGNVTIFAKCTLCEHQHEIGLYIDYD